jgi:hypothetical protein
MNKNVSPEFSSKRKSSESDKDFNEPDSTESKSDMVIIHKQDKAGNPVAFSIPVENCSPCRQPPKRLCNAKKNKKADTSVEILNKKQALAEERRQVKKSKLYHRLYYWSQ